MAKIALGVVPRRKRREQAVHGADEIDMRAALFIDLAQLNGKIVDDRNPVQIDGVECVGHLLAGDTERPRIAKGLVHSREDIAPFAAVQA